MTTALSAALVDHLPLEMLDRIGNSGERLRDVAAVALPNGAILAAINLVQVNALISITGGALTIAYAVWRWRRDIKNGK